MLSKLNPVTAQLSTIVARDHPAFVRLWTDLGVTCVTQDNCDAFLAQDGLVLLFLVDDPNLYKETLDLVTIAPELIAAFGPDLSHSALSDPAHGRAIAASRGIHRLPAVLIACFGQTLGTIEGLRTWADYEKEIVSILCSVSPPKKTICITALEPRDNHD